jgi:IS30 family transposase
MKQRPRIYYSDAQKALMWDRWKDGATLHEIAKLFDRAHSSVHGILSETGGIRPAERRRSGLALTLAEREEISVLVTGHSIRAIAAQVDEHKSTVSREISAMAVGSGIGRTGRHTHWVGHVKRCKLARTAPCEHRDSQAAAVVVTRTNRWMAQAYLPRR